MTTPLLPLALGAASSGALFLRERLTRQSSERLAAALLETLLNTMDATDPETGAHVRRVARYALILAAAADIDEHGQHAVERVALFHDIGKLDEALFDIIHEEHRLSPDERNAIATHPSRGADVLAPLSPFYPELAEGVLCHHERWDGTGYPRRLAGEQIPIEARIVAIADTFDAVTHARRYRAGRPAREGVRVIQEGRATQFDPMLVDLFLSPPVLDEIVEAVRASLQRPGRQTRERRGARPGIPAPDVSFRWRDGGPEPPR